MSLAGFSLPSRRPPIVSKRHMNVRRERLMMAACVMEILDDDELVGLKGRMLGSNNIKRTRKTVEGMFTELGPYARKAYRMSLDAFYVLHDTLEDALRQEFNVSERKRGSNPNGNISTKLRLSAALRFFAGADVYSIILTHGIGLQTVYDSVYGIVNAVNESSSFSFNRNEASFPSHAEQREIALGFLEKSGAGFDKIVMALDGMLVWTSQPSKRDCNEMKIGQRLWHCYRKDKYGWLLMAGCDHETRFRWADIRHPASTSDYLAWVTSDVGRKLDGDDSDLILPNHSIAGDNAFVENMTMSTPIPGHNVPPHEDAYNFYLSQIRITIERAFGILIHRWGILRRPLDMSVQKVPAIVTCLMRLHNFCIDHDSRKTPSPICNDERVVSRSAQRTKGKDSGVSHRAITLDNVGRPDGLLGAGHHFHDEPGGRGRRPDANINCRHTPMRQMIKQVKDQDLTRPDQD
ncbi:hypothetical protein ACHAWF_012614 [Thalassiosira exigua]